MEVPQITHLVLNIPSSNVVIIWLQCFFAITASLVPMLEFVLLVLLLSQPIVHIKIMS